MNTKRPLFYFGIIFSLSAIFFLYLRTNILISISIALIAVEICFLLCKFKKNAVFLLSAVILASAVVTGFNITIKSPFEKLYGRHIRVQGYISDTYTKNGTQYMTCKVQIPNAKGIIKNSHCILRSYRSISANAGEYFSSDIAVDLNERKYEYFNLSGNIHFTGTIESDVEKIQENIYPLLDMAVKTKLYINENLHKRLRGDSFSIASAVITGSRNSLNHSLEGYLKKSGIIHMVAVSGMHMAILSKIITSLLAVTGMNIRLRGVLSIPFIWIYGFICGFPPATVRSAVMITIALIGAEIFRKSDSLNSLGLAAVITLVFNPYIVLNAGFQMSYLAVAGISSIGPDFLKRQRDGLSDLRIKIEKSIFHSTSAWLFVLPVSAVRFGYLSLFSPLTNLILTPFIPMVMLSALFTGILPPNGISDKIALVFASLCSACVKIIVTVSSLIAEIPFSIIRFDENWKYIWIIACILIFAAAIFRFKNISVRRICFLSMILLFLIGTSADMVLNRNTVKIISSPEITALQYKNKSIILDIAKPMSYYHNPDDFIDDNVDIPLVILHNDKMLESSLLKELSEEHKIDKIAADRNGYTDSYLKYMNFEEIVDLKPFIYEIFPDFSLEYAGNGTYKIKLNDILILKKTEDCDIIESSNSYDIILDSLGVPFVNRNMNKNISFRDKIWGWQIKIYKE